MKIRSHRELNVYTLSFKLAVEIFNLTKSFPKEEMYSLSDQIRRSSRSVCANIAEGFRKRRYPKHFVSKLSDSESEAAETQVWLEFSLEFGYIDKQKYNDLNEKYENVCPSLQSLLPLQSLYSLPSL